jgi:hypothetical protein
MKEKASAIQVFMRERMSAPEKRQFGPIGNFNPKWW